MVKMKNLYTIAVVLLILTFPHITAADDLDDQDSFKCAGGIVEINDTEFQVLEKCGKPTAKTEYGTVWIYDRGPSYFVYYITVSDGTVDRIQSGDYGR